jgi:hypothetical protein
VDRLGLVRECYRAYETRDRAALDRALSAGFTFYSPPDPGIDRAAYFERCWPNADTIASFELKRLAEIGDDEVPRHLRGHQGRTAPVSATPRS